MLEWQNPRTDERGYRSTCNRYSISSTGDGAEERWQTWKLVPMGAWFAPLATGLMTELEARKCAQLDLDSRRP